MKKLLIGEDDQFLSAAYKAKFAKAGFEVLILSDGEEVMAKIDEYKPDLLILDIMMPKKDGFSVLEELRTSEKWKALPILVASNLGQKEDIDKAIRLGANGYIVKSDLRLEEIIEKIKSLLPKD